MSKAFSFVLKLKNFVSATIAILVVVIITGVVENTLKPDGFWDGYIVEFTGMLLELVVVYFVVDYITSRQRRKKSEVLKAPVHTQLLKHIEIIHLHLFRSLELHLTAANRKQVSPDFFPKIGFIYRHEQLVKFRDKLERHLVHASFHLGTESYAKTMDFIDSTNELLSLVDDLQDILAHHPPPEGYSDGRISTAYTRSIRKRHFQLPDDFYFWLQQTYTIDNEHFTHDYMLSLRRNAPKAQKLLELASSVEWIKLDD